MVRSSWNRYGELMAKTILILAANPKDTPQLRLEQEIREIDNGLERALKRDEFKLEQVLAARPKDVRRAMLDLEPNIVHFCGHGTGEDGIAFEDEEGNTKLVNASAIAKFFELFADKVECVVLNACYSEIQAKAIAQHINYVIGMSKAIGDKAAVEFAVALYDALGAGKNVEFAYKLACNAIQWAGLPEHLTPILKKRSDELLGNNDSIETSSVRSDSKQPTGTTRGAFTGLEQKSNSGGNGPYRKEEIVEGNKLDVGEGGQVRQPFWTTLPDILMRTAVLIIVISLLIAILLRLQSLISTTKLTDQKEVAVLPTSTPSFIINARICAELPTPTSQFSDDCKSSCVNWVARCDLPEDIISTTQSVCTNTCDYVKNRQIDSMHQWSTDIRPEVRTGWIIGLRISQKEFAPALQAACPGNCEKWVNNCDPFADGYACEKTCKYATHGDDDAPNEDLDALRRWITYTGTTWSGIIDGLKIAQGSTLEACKP